MARLLITGGAGFIGSHTCLVLLAEGHRLIVLDNLSNGSAIAIERIAKIANVNLGSKDLELVRGDLRDKHLLEEVFVKSMKAEDPIEGVLHFAGLKAVGESIKKPLEYWDINVLGVHNLLTTMHDYNCHTLVFSSSATLYGYPDRFPIPETATINPINPYGQTKRAAEQLISDVAMSSPDVWKVSCLRYFNPVGAHPSGHIGEDPLGIPNNLFPIVSQVAVGRRSELLVYGGDWPTHDGTAIRDYIHVMDLAEGHLAALRYLISESPQLLQINLGSGQGHSVLEVIKAFEMESGRVIPYKIVDRRPGDAALSIADASLAAKLLNWKTTRCLREICRDGWKWQQANPLGYQKSK